MKPRSLIVVGCVLLLALAWVVARRVDWFRGGPNADALAGKALLDSTPGEWTKIEITPRDGRAVRLVKAAGAWRLAAPIDAKADADAVNALADTLRNLRFNRGVVTKGPDAEGDEMTGLGKPAWKVRIEAGAASAEIGVGNGLAGQAATYVRAGKAAGVVPVDLAKLLGRPAAELRDKKVLRLEESKIAKLTLSTGAGSVELARGADEKWALLAPVSAPADQEAVNKIVHAAADLTAVEFVPGKGKGLEAYGLTGPAVQAKVRIEMKAPAPATATASAPAGKAADVYTLLLGAKGQTNLYARLEGGEDVFLVAPDVLEALRPDVQALRRKRLLDVTASEVEALSIGKARLEKKNFEWLVREPVAGKADPEAVEKFVQTLCDFEAEKFADEAAPPGLYGLDTPAAAIQLRLAGKDKTVTVLIGSRGDATGEKRFVKLADGKAVAVVSAEKVKPLVAEYWTLLDRHIWQLPAGARPVSVQVAREGVSVELAAREGGWSMVKPIEAAVDAEQVGKLLGRLRSLRADGIAAFPAVPEAIANAKDQAVIRLGVEIPTPVSTSMPAQVAAALPKEVKTFTFHVVKVEGKVCAWVEGLAVTAVGEFAETFHADLTGELRDRTLSRIAPDQVKQVRLTSGQDVAELVRTEAGWRYAAGKYVDMDADKIRDFLQDVAAVKAERFVAHADPGTFGVAQGKNRVELTDVKGQVVTISLSDRGPNAGGRFATVTGVPGVAVISSADVMKLDKTWKDFKKSDKPDKTETPGMPGMPE